MSTKTTAAGGRSFFLSRLLGKKRQPSRVPDGSCVYAVGDIHGRLDLLEPLLGKIRTHAGASTSKNSLVFLGDYIDRGPQSKEVVDHLLQLEWPGWDVIFLRGNHEQAALDFLADGNFYRVWRGLGAVETLLSYGVIPPHFGDDEAFAEARNEFAAKLPPAHLEFFSGLKYFHVIGDYLFVHAGVRPGIALNRQLPEDLMWIRDEFLLSDRQLDKIVVHGHTPAPSPIKQSCRINVDTGAYATGVLTAAALEGEDCKFITTTDT